MRRILIVLIVVLLAATVLGSTQAAGEYYVGYDSITSSNCTSAGGTLLGPISYNMPATGGTYSGVQTVNGSITNFFDHYPISGTGSTVYGSSWPASGYPYTADLIWDTYIDGVLVYRSYTTLTCTADGSGVVSLTNTDMTVTNDPVPGPGPDMVALPAGAVVGQFVDNAFLHYAPTTEAQTTITMTSGKTLWVTGTSADNMYYQVLLSGQKFWVPAASIGPNYDDVWNGTPLPTTVVE